MSEDQTMLGFGDPTARRSSTDISAESVQSFQNALAAGTPILQALYKQLQDTYGTLDGVGYALTNDNQLPSDWLAQTPNVWGQSADDVEIGAGDFIAQDVQDLVSSATKFVDITSLFPYPTGQFMDAIQKGLVSLAASGRAVKVRILIGSYPSVFSSQSDYLATLIAPLMGGQSGNLEVYVAAQRTDPLTWNHAKMVAVDGLAAMLGGENQWDADYLETEPVHDLNLKIQGSAVFHMHRFADSIWSGVCGYDMPDWYPAYWQSGDTSVSTKCLDTSLPAPVSGQGTISMLGAGRYGGTDNPADSAMLLALQSSQSVIRIAQQDLEMYEDYWKPCMKIIAKAIIKEQDVYIVISNDEGKAGSGNTYSTGTVAHTADRIRDYVIFENGSDDGVTELLCQRLHLSTLRFGPSNEWPNGYEFANHAKFFMVDDEVFYVGSENLYPSDLIEYGVFISDPDAVQQMKTEYWDQLWKYSSRVAISGSDAPSCYFS